MKTRRTLALGLSAVMAVSPFVSAVVLELELPQPDSTETAITADNPNASVLLLFIIASSFLLVGFIIDPIPLVFERRIKRQIGIFLRLW